MLRRRADGEPGARPRGEGLRRVLGVEGGSGHRAVGLGDLGVPPSRRDARLGGEGERDRGRRAGGGDGGAWVGAMLPTSSDARDCPMCRIRPGDRLRPPVSVGDGLAGCDCGAMPARGCPMRWRKDLGGPGSGLGGGGVLCQGGSSMLGPSSQEGLGGPSRRLPGREDGGRKGVLISGFTALVGGSGCRVQAWGSHPGAVTPGGLLRRDGRGDRDLPDPSMGTPKRRDPGADIAVFGGARGAAGGSGLSRRRLAPRDGERRTPSPRTLPGCCRAGGGEPPGFAKGLRSEGGRKTPGSRGGGCPHGPPGGEGSLEGASRGGGSRPPPARTDPELSISTSLRLKRL